MKQVILATVLFMSFVSFAQRGEHFEAHHKVMKDFTPEQIAILETKKLTLALDLTEVQQQEIQELSLEKAIMRKQRMEERKAEKASSEKRQFSSDELFERQSERLDRAIAHKKQMREILTEEQYTKWERLSAHRGKKRMERHSRKGRK